VVASLEAVNGYHIGCPRAALVAIEDGPGPRPAEIAQVDPAGGVTPEVRKLGEANLAGHKKEKQDRP
jgi:hypothetical protein